ncbi:MAG: DUF1501 domain-containing protein [Candidatus Omnitrophica bacterium]|nr:DUF1501 domain-containing protein [Candidatus Omnitrophota bacterium]MCM8802156.1 DUF1501 domain-containing protein [Candidatus Omnitrophota bacterium]
MREIYSVVTKTFLVLSLLFSEVTFPASEIKPKAKSVIQIWLWGGPSHLDTFDPKPNADYDYTGPFKSIPTNVPGIEINEYLVNLAKIADKYSIIRSMTHGINGHETAAYLMQTGHSAEENLVYPSIGAVVSLFKGYDYGYKNILPPYIVLTTSQGRFSECGFLGERYKPFVTGGDPNKTPFAVEGIVLEGVTEERKQARKELLYSIDLLGKFIPWIKEFKSFDLCREKAYEILSGEIAKVFDLTLEPDEIRNMYGRNTFGQSCLVARRLIEKGVIYVTVNYRGWDTHSNHFQQMKQKLPELDMGLSSLIKDLSDRGLLDSTIIWVSGEFGRTPKIQWEPPWNGGRNHYGKCFSVLVAGGGFKGGCVVGASDEKGENVIDRPVYPKDLLGSIYYLLGINPETKFPKEFGKDVTILPPIETGEKKGLLKEIMYE